MSKHIHILSPSGAINPTLIDGTIARLRTWGFNVSVGTHAREQWGRFAATDNQRIDNLLNALQDPTIDIILCARGGYGLQRIIDQLPPIHKPIIGFSDITALHMLAAQTNQPTLHAPMCKHIASENEESEPIRAMRQILNGQTTTYHFHAHPLNRIGQVNAPVIGGNLSVLYGLQATPFALAQAIASNQQPILLIEDICERHYHIDRMMHNLRMSGVLAQISGLIVGQFTDCENDPSMPSTIEQTIYEAVADYNYPVCFNAPFGHFDGNLPIWLHTPIQMSVSDSEVTLNMPSPLS